MNTTTTTLSRTVLALCLALGGASVVGCSESSTIDNADQLAENIRRQQVDGFVQTFALELPSRAVRAAEQRAETPQLVSSFDEVSQFESDPMFRGLIAELYQERAYSPVFVQGSTLAPAGRQAIEVLSAAGLHGLDPQNYHVQAIIALNERLARGAELEAFRQRFVLTPEDENQLVGWVSAHAGADETLPAVNAVFDRIATAQSDSESPLPRVTQAINELRVLIEDVATAGPEIELRLMSGVMRYANDLKFSHIDPLLPSEIAERGWDISTEEGVQSVVRTRLATGIREAIHSDVGAWMAALSPPVEQYRRLLDGVVEYTNYVQAGGWEPVELPLDMGSGASSADVLALRVRLASENYLPLSAVQNREWDQELRDAVEHYQTTHQLNITGRISEETLMSLNVPAARRLAQVHTTQERWRNARSLRHAGQEFVWVNVPDFHAELWDQDERVYRWRVVTGRPRYSRDRRGNEVVQGRTVLFSDTMLYIVFNPYWNVPSDIRDNEYQPLMDADPNWLYDNGFELVTTESGGDYLRQLPGPANALGIVKFLFPNEHDIYMHDTPSRSLFSRSIRAFSHGCIRIENPLDFARLLLRRDRGWSESYTEDYVLDQLASGAEKWVSLVRPLPVHIEYFGVRGDDGGRMNYLADIYRYDRDRVDEIEALITARYSNDEAVIVDDEATSDASTSAME
jgi:murein L,D-transpeptidase YcbB/YkuD